MNERDQLTMNIDREIAPQVAGALRDRVLPSIDQRFRPNLEGEIKNLETAGTKGHGLHTEEGRGTSATSR